MGWNHGNYCDFSGCLFSMVLGLFFLGSLSIPSAYHHPCYVWFYVGDRCLIVGPTGNDLGRKLVESWPSTFSIRTDEV